MDITNDEIPADVLPLTIEEQEHHSKIEEDLQAIYQAEIDKAALRQATMIKLNKLGLTEEEAKAIVGL